MYTRKRDQRGLVVLEEGATLPRRGSSGAGAYDLCALSSTTIMPDSMKVVHTGVHVSPPNGCMGLLFMRSGHSKMGLRLSTGVSIIDADYTGEILAYVHNDSEDQITIEKGERFCQLAFVPYMAPQLEVVGELPKTDRGGGGFGSTGR